MRQPPSAPSRWRQLSSNVRQHKIIMASSPGFAYSTGSIRVYKQFAAALARLSFWSGPASCRPELQDEAATGRRSFCSQLPFNFRTVAAVKSPNASASRVSRSGMRSPGATTHKYISANANSSWGRLVAAPAQTGKTCCLILCQCILGPHRWQYCNVLPNPSLKLSTNGVSR